MSVKVHCFCLFQYLLFILSSSLFIFHLSSTFFFPANKTVSAYFLCFFPPFSTLISLNSHEWHSPPHRELQEIDLFHSHIFPYFFDLIVGLLLKVERARDQNVSNDGHDYSDVALCRVDHAAARWPDRVRTVRAAVAREAAADAAVEVAPHRTRRRRGRRGDKRRHLFCDAFSFLSGSSPPSLLPP